MQELRGPGSYNPPNSAPVLARPSPAFQDKQGRFDQPLQTLVPPVSYSHEKTQSCLNCNSVTAVEETVSRGERYMMVILNRYGLKQATRYAELTLF